jgi:hypothetical protein
MRFSFNFRRLQSALALTTWAVASLSCTSESGSDDKESEACETGTERCECYRNDSCDDGLMCVSDVCVESTGADDEQDAGGDSPNEDDAPGAEPDESEGEGAPDETEEEPTESEEEPTDSEEEPTDAEEEPTDAEEEPTDAEEEPTESDAAVPADDGENTEPTDETSNETPEQQELQDGSVGSACGECDAELLCIPDVPGGYCTAECATDADCGAGGACVENVCYRECDADADCRPSYACVNAGDVSVCDVGEPTDTGSGTQTGSCANTCEHYLTCKGIFDAETQQTCEGNCASSGYSADDLAAFQTTDCETAIYMVEGPASSEGGGSSGGGGVDCDGCQWDGSSCVYLSQYTLISTGGITCDASCCG